VKKPPGITKERIEEIKLNNQWFEHLKQEYVQGFPKWCGFEVTRVDHGVFETCLALQPQHLQQDGFVHAGVISTMADHTAGYAAFTIVSQADRILTIEFKINFFKPAVGESIACRSRVIQGGRKIIVSESEVFSRSEKNEKRVSKATVTLMSVPAESIQPCR